MFTSNSPVIAGKNCGIPIEATPQAQQVFNLLKSQAHKNYWAHMIVSGINALCSGQMSVNNVFVKEQALANGSEFYVVLPGCTASMQKLPSGRYKLIHMTADVSYFEGQMNNEKPGLYEAQKIGYDWNTRFVNDGRVSNEKNRFVVITECTKAKPSLALKTSFEYFKDNPLTTSYMLESGDKLNMHFTPGKKQIGGWKNLKQARNADTDSELHESAILLAKTMADAKDTKGVQWVSERGGSGVLTQALKILADQNITLKKHAVFLCHPTTSQSKLVSLSMQVGLGQPRQISKNATLRPDELIGGLGFAGGYVTAFQRFKNDDKYDGYKLVGDLTKETLSVKSAAGTTAAIGAAVGVTAAGMSMPAVAAFAGAAIGVVGLGKTLTEAYLPRLYYKIKGKF